MIEPSSLCRPTFVAFVVTSLKCSSDKVELSALEVSVRTYLYFVPSFSIVSYISKSEFTVGFVSEPVIDLPDTPDCLQV